MFRSIALLFVLVSGPAIAQEQANGERVFYKKYKGQIIFINPAIKETVIRWEMIALPGEQLMEQQVVELPLEGKTEDERRRKLERYKEAERLAFQRMLARAEADEKNMREVVANSLRPEMEESLFYPMSESNKLALRAGAIRVKRSLQRKMDLIRASGDRLLAEAELKIAVAEVKFDDAGKEIAKEAREKATEVEAEVNAVIAKMKEHTEALKAAKLEILRLRYNQAIDPEVKDQIIDALLAEIQMEPDQPVKPKRMTIGDQW